MRKPPPATPRAKPAPPEADPAGRILDALRAAGARGLSKPALLGAPARRGFPPPSPGW